MSMLRLRSRRVKGYEGVIQVYMVVVVHYNGVRHCATLVSIACSWQ